MRTIPPLLNAPSLPPAADVSCPSLGLPRSSSGMSVLSTGSGSSGSAPAMDLRERLLIASMLLGTGRVEPWPPTLAALVATGGQQVTRAFVRLLELRYQLPGEQLVPEQSVLASDGDDKSVWQKGQLVSSSQLGQDKRGEKRWVHEVRLSSGSSMKAKHVLLAKDTGGMGALLQAAAARDDGLPLVDCLIRAGLSVSYADEDVNTALHVAATYGHPDICRRLRDAGLDPFAFNAQGVRAYDIAVNSTDNLMRTALKPTNMQLELEPDAAQPPLLQVARRSEPELVRSLEGELEGGVEEVNVADSKGVTALMIACAYGFVDGVDALLNAGADQKMKTKSGCTALTMAAERGHVDTVEVLLDEEDDVAEELVNISESGNITALMRACQNGPCLNGPPLLLLLLLHQPIHIHPLCGSHSAACLCASHFRQH